MGTSVMLLILEEMLAVFPFTDFGYGQHITYYAEVLPPASLSGVSHEGMWSLLLGFTIS